MVCRLTLLRARSSRSQLRLGSDPCKCGVLPVYFNCNEVNNMSFLAWIVLGLLAGFIGSKIVNKKGEGVILDILLGIVGAVLGGWLFNTFGASGVTGVNLYSLLVAVIGSVVLPGGLSRCYASRLTRARPILTRPDSAKIRVGHRPPGQICVFRSRICPADREDASSPTNNPAPRLAWLRACLRPKLDVGALSAH